MIACVSNHQRQADLVILRSDSGACHPFAMLCRVGSLVICLNGHAFHESASVFFDEVAIDFQREGRVVVAKVDL